MLEITVTTIGEGLGIYLPDEVIQQLDIAEGDRLFLIPDSHGYLLLTGDCELAVQVIAAEGIMHRYPNALRELAD
ncbi:MAG: AbrB/MazE/SpoVT family DNA-binding domain-containing protein [Chlorobia bacterium]|nr:AbrB/MazE/SpoVT family DNA-binding domain-containing protein [Fimbriimonadaceae bacterium]